MIKRSLFRRKDDAPLKIIEVQDLRTNLYLEVQIFSGQHHVRTLASILDKKKTLVYFDTIALLRSVQDELVKLRPDLRIDAYFSTRDDKSKDDAMEKFVKGDIDTLLATDAAGMGCDIPDIAHVIQYGLPHDMTSLVQRFGRAARNPEKVSKGIATLLAPPVTTKKKYEKKPD
ncbi:ATP-dependent DNA helicase sgs1, partial [Actinomortierella wolfii]